MRVYCYDPDKNVVPVEFSIDDAVALGIDPCRVDLFDPKPVHLQADGKALLGTALQPISFAYDDGDQTVIGVYDGKHQHCLRGSRYYSSCTDGRKSAGVISVKPCEEPFNVHFREYLLRKEQWQKKPGNVYGAGPYDLSRADNIVFQDGTIYFYNPVEGHGERLAKFSFSGEMFHKITMQAKLAPEVNWFLTTFALCEPIVIGESLMPVDRSTSCSEIDCIVNASRLHAFVRSGHAFPFESANEHSHFYRNVLPMEMCSLRRDGVIYNIFLGQGTVSEAAKGFWKANDFSITQFYAQRPGEINASRIALCDLAAKRVRLISFQHIFGLWREEKTRKRAEEFRKLGFTVAAHQGGFDLQ